ncbi:MAG TPA: alanine dehydrogenase [Burkholderiales bacterium]|nr:alanine dehydrogenase [Burkholderiales bacterium]
MRIGIPREIKIHEGRVALTPPAAGELANHGHEVWLQSGAGVASGYADADYAALGVKILPEAAAVYERAELVLKVKEPIASEYRLLRGDHILFSYLHLAAMPELMNVLRERGLTAVAFETVEEQGQLPLLAPMSDIAGRLSVQIGATLLHGYRGGRGILLGGLPATEHGHVVVLGAGVAGGNAAAVAAALGANVTVLARSRDSLERMQRIGPNVTALPSYAETVEQAVLAADLLVGAVLIPGAKTPRLVSRHLVSRMQPGSVIVDISVDQGGCIETTRPTDYDNPTYMVDGVVHFAVTNMPGAVPRTASQALSTALLPYVLKLAARDGLHDPAIAAGINVRDGRVVHPALRRLEH